MMTKPPAERQIQIWKGALVPRPADLADRKLFKSTSLPNLDKAGY